MTKGIEHNIRLNVAIIYFIVGLACCTMVFYLYNIRGNIEEQQKEIERHRKSLALTNELVYAVSGIQSAGGKYISTGNPGYLRSYREQIVQIGVLIDSITVTGEGDVKQPGLLKLDTLLRRQMAVIYELGTKLAGENPLDDINKKLRDMEPVRRRDSVWVTTVNQDTIVDAAPKKGFFRRLWRAFAPGKDSVVVLSNQYTNTLNITLPDTLAIIREVDSVVRVAGEGYYENIRVIGKQVGRLAASDQQIMEQISAVLMEMYSGSLNSILAAVDESERIIARNYAYSVVGGGLALVLVFILIAVIVNGVNKARMARMALERVNSKDRQIMESRHKLLLSVSHDLKTPLNSILGYLELQRSEGQDVRSMLSSGNYILSLWENLIEFSSIEQGTLKVSPVPFRLREFFETITAMFEPLAAKKGIAFEYVFRFDEGEIVTGDSLKIKQIIVNLISNAVKYTVRGSVRLEATLEENLLVCRIKDTGAGIPGELKTEIFTPFRRVEQNNVLAEGSGLGLYVVRELTGLLGGSVELVSQVGKGSEFTVSVPVEKVNPDTTEGGRLPVENGVPLRISVIDDDAVLLSVAGEMLTALGHTVSAVSRMEEIGTCDIILADMEMGAFTGLDVLKNAGDTPVVIMTARSGFTGEEAVSLGFAAYIPKPFTLYSLERVFGRVKAPAAPAESEEVPPHLKALFGEDVEAMRETLEVFRIATEMNLAALREALENKDYPTARGLCHKMLPMFAQLGYAETAGILRKVDMHLNEAYEGWQADVEKICGDIAELLAQGVR